MFLYLHYPSWLRPEIIPGLPVRWYGLMIILAIVISFVLTRIQVRERALDMTDDDLSSFYFYIIIGMLVGARLFSALIYDTSGTYLRQPWLIFWPFDQNMRLVGLQGLSYHGGLVGAILAVFIYSRVKKMPFLQWTDIIAASVPLGYTLGRLGNFFNAELYGRATLSPLGMLFPDARRLPVAVGWVAEYANELGIEAVNGMVNLPRHPSQLYEAFFEGIFLFAIIWFVVRPKKPASGVLTGVYIAGYGLVRFIIEYFRTPDADLGFVLPLGGGGDIARTSSLLNITTGQILCLLMILAGGLLIVVARQLENRQAASKASASEKNKVNLRKLRKKIGHRH